MLALDCLEPVQRLPSQHLILGHLLQFPDGHVEFPCQLEPEPGLRVPTVGAYQFFVLSSMLTIVLNCSTSSASALTNCTGHDLM